MLHIVKWERVGSFIQSPLSATAAINFSEHWELWHETILIWNAFRQRFTIYDLRNIWKMASQAFIWERKAFPSPWPSEAPLTRPAISTTLRNAGTLLENRKYNHKYSQRPIRWRKIFVFCKLSCNWTNIWKNPSSLRSFGNFLAKIGLRSCFHLNNHLVNICQS